MFITSRNSLFKLTIVRGIGSLNIPYSYYMLYLALTFCDYKQSLAILLASHFDFHKNPKHVTKEYFNHREITRSESTYLS